MTETTFIQLTIRAYHIEVLEPWLRKLLTQATLLGMDMKGPTPLPQRIQRITVLKSPHVHKKARDQYEVRTLSRVIVIQLSPCSRVQHLVHCWLQYLQALLPSGLLLTTRMTIKLSSTAND